MLRAVQNADAPTARKVSVFLADALREDASWGKDITPVVDAALEGMREPNEKGVLCAHVAAAGWRFGLLDEKAKQAIVRRCLTVALRSRPVYPTGFSGPRPELTWKCDLGVRVKANCTVVVNDEYTTYSGSVAPRPSPEPYYKSAAWSVSAKYPPPPRHGLQLPDYGIEATDDVSIPPGEHTAVLQVTVQLGAAKQSFNQSTVKILSENPIKTKTLYNVLPAMEAWQMELAPRRVSFEVSNEMQAESLRAPVTPELVEKIKESVHLRRSDGTSYGVNVVEYSKNDPHPIVAVEQPLPVDLVFRPLWKVKDTDKSYVGEAVILSGDRLTADLYPPDQMVFDALSGRRKAMDVILVLEPAPDIVVVCPEVTQYWPAPIVLPQFELAPATYHVFLRY